VGSNLIGKYTVYDTDDTYIIQRYDEKFGWYVLHSPTTTKEYYALAINDLIYKVTRKDNPMRLIMNNIF